MRREEQQLRDHHHRQHQHQHQHHQSNVFQDLSAIVLTLLRSPIPFGDHSSQMRMMRRSPPLSQITPSGFASMLLGVSVSLMLCGSVTFFIGFLLMPWVIVLVIVLYIVGVVSTISMVGRSILCYMLAPPSSHRHDIPAWKLT